MELFRLEHKKLWQKNSTRICVLICFAYCVVLGSFLIYQWISFGSHKSHMGGKNFDGYENIRSCQDYVGEYGGVLTDESLQEWVRENQHIYASLEEERETQGAENMETVHKLYSSDLYVVNGWLGELYPELERADMSGVKIMSGYVEPEQLTDLYERRQNAIDRFLEISGQTGAERDYLLQINDKVQAPFSWRWAEGWSHILGNLVSGLGTVMALFLAIVLGPLFAGEWHDNTSPLILTTKNGWRSLAAAKIFTGLSFTLELFVMQAVGTIVFQLVYLGTEGWDMPIQMIKMIAIAPMNMLQAEIYEFAFTLLGALGYAGVVMLFSAFCKNHVAALLLSLSVKYGPDMIKSFLIKDTAAVWLEKAFDLIPLVGSGADVFRTNTFCMFGRYIWSPYLLVTVPVLLGMTCLPFAVRGWSRKMRR